jgi:hypothetical protein
MYNLIYTGALNAGATELNPSSESTGVVPQIIVAETNQQEDAVKIMFLSYI